MALSVVLKDHSAGPGEPNRASPPSSVSVLSLPPSRKRLQSCLPRNPGGVDQEFPNALV